MRASRTVLACSVGALLLLGSGQMGVIATTHAHPAAMRTATHVASISSTNTEVQDPGTDADTAQVQQGDQQGPDSASGAAETADTPAEPAPGSDTDLVDVQQ